MPKVSVLVTVRNEARNLGALLESLEGQRHLHEVIVVDGGSTDGTLDVAGKHAKRLPLKVIHQECTRGEGRNIAARQASGDLLAFTDGDCVADSQWLDRMVAAWQGLPMRIVAGHTRVIGRSSFQGLHRVELPHRGQDTSWPSCNLAYPRSLFETLGGFDPSFVTAEDIDLNYRAVTAGAKIVHARDAVIQAQARHTVGGFLRQGFWNGYGRKQLTRKHGRLWGQYRLSDMLRRQASFWGILRLGAGFTGYMVAKAGRRR